MNDRHSARSTGAQVRGDIQSGITGDKRPGFDPALAPLETDSEAGGSGLDPAQADLARASQRRTPDRSRSKPSFNSAMRGPEGASARSSRWIWPAAIAVAVILALGVFVLLQMS